MSAPEFRLSAFLERATPSAASSAGLLAKPSRRLFFPIFGRADDDVEQLQLAAQNGDGSFQEPACRVCVRLPERLPGSGSKNDFSLLDLENSVGRNLQVKGRCIASFSCPLLAGPTSWLLTRDQGERCALAPLLRKLRAPSVIGAGSRKAWRALRDGSASTEDLRSLIFPRRKILSRKSECLGRAVSLSPRRRNLLRRPTGPLRTPSSGLPERTLPQECRASLTDRSA